MSEVRLFTSKGWVEAISLHFCTLKIVCGRVEPDNWNQQSDAVNLYVAPVISLSLLPCHPTQITGVIPLVVMCVNLIFHNIFWIMTHTSSFQWISVFHPLYGFASGEIIGVWQRLPIPWIFEHTSIPTVDEWTWCTLGTCMAGVNAHSHHIPCSVSNLSDIHFS